MTGTIFNMEELMYALVTDSSRPDPADLFFLAGLRDEEIAELRSFWTLVPTRRRAFVVQSCVSLLDGSPSLQFNAFFRSLLDDPEPVVRHMAVEGLAVDAELASADLILRCLDGSEDERVRFSAIRTTGRLILTGETRSWSSEVLRTMVWRLIQLSESPAENLELRCGALESLGYGSDADIPHVLEEALESEWEEMRVSALVAIGRSADASWRGYLLDAMDDPETAVRAAAMRAAGRLRLSEFLDACLTVLEYEEDLELRAAAMETLARLGGSVAYHALLVAAEADDGSDAESLERAFAILSRSDGLEPDWD